MSEVNGKRSVADIIIDRILSDAEEKGSMPWQRPYEMYNSFNYFTKKLYRGINRLILPFGEYITKNQINDYNKKHGTSYRFAKGIKWYPVVFFTVQEKEISRDEVANHFDNVDEDGYIGTSGVWNYFNRGDGKFVKKRNVLKYTSVADRKYFVDENGNTLPSRVDTGEVSISMENPEKIFDDYIKKSGVSVVETIGVPCYSPNYDEVALNKHVKGEEDWFSVAFHELAHSTGHAKRLNREGVAGTNRDKNIYAVEECIAEITASLLCGECGVYEFKTSGMSAYDNNLAYISSWKKRIKDWGKEFIYIVSQADKAFYYILGDEESEDNNR